MADPESTDDETEYEGPSSQTVVMDAFLTPFRALFSRAALRIYLNILLFTGAALLMLGVSGVAYGIFYFKYIPTVGVDREVHLQFGDNHPWGTASFGTEFVSFQPYDVAVTLDLPRTPSNLNVGNFMVDLTLFAPQASSVLPTSGSRLETISHSRRSAMMTYVSPLVDVAHRMVRLPFYVVGWHREAEILEVPMMEKVKFARGTSNLPKALRLEIQSDGRMQVYSARVQFRARFTGLRWLMYRWKLTSFIMFSCLFWTVSMASMSLTWFLLNWTRQPETRPKNEIEVQEVVKGEPEVEDTRLSDDPVKFKKEESVGPESSMKLQNYPEHDDGAFGSGLETAEAIGVQRRRGHWTENDV